MTWDRVLAAGLASCLALSGCGNDNTETVTPAQPGTGGTAGAGGSNGGAAARGGSGGGNTSQGSEGSANPLPAGSGGSGGSGMSSPANRVPSPGCGETPGYQSGTHALDAGGLSRSFILDLPPNYDSAQAYPLVFGFHGRGFSAAEFRSSAYGNLPSVAGSEAILVHPDGLGDEERAWDTESERDIVFFDALLDALLEGLCVDESRVFATGHSSGGYFTNLLGCERGDVLKAIAPVAGGGPFGDGGGTPSCKGPLSAWIAHAENDETVLFSNGEGSLDYWLTSDACDAEAPTPTAPEPCVTYARCSRGLAVNWCVYESGHDWPPFATRGIWAFFKGL